MSGHSKWAQIKRQKGVNDARRGQLFTRLGREIIVAVREGGGGDPNTNFRLRKAIEAARAANMPMDNIDRSIKRALGGGEGAQLEEITYEGYAPGGAAVMVRALTDNRNRTVAEVRNIFSKNGGNLGENGCVDWIFEMRGVLEIEIGAHDADELSLELIDAGAEDVDPASDGDETLTAYTAANEVDQVREAIEAKRLTVTRAETSLIPKTTVDLDEKTSLQAMRMIERLEDLDDVQDVYTNAGFNEDALAQMA
jgi:YebC/PmpR family DNA-binding regulatory protein